jgi:type VI protein secretion system component VasF
MTTALERLGDRLEKRIDAISEANTRALIAFQQAAADDRKSDRYDRRVFNTVMLLGVLSLAGINVYFKGITLTTTTTTTTTTLPPVVVEAHVPDPADAEHAPVPVETDL